MGVVATGAHYLVLLIAVELLQLVPFLASSMGATVGAVVAYFGNRHFTFASSRKHHIAMPRFFFIATVGAIFNGAIVGLGSEIFKFHYFLAQLAATFITLFLTFKLNRTWAFAV